MRVLVVEDETRLAETVRRGLAAEGFNVEVVSNGEDGLTTYARTPDSDKMVLKTVAMDYPLVCHSAVVGRPSHLRAKE